MHLTHLVNNIKIAYGLVNLPPSVAGFLLDKETALVLASEVEFAAPNPVSAADAVAPSVGIPLLHFFPEEERGL